MDLRIKSDSFFLQFCFRSGRLIPVKGGIRMTYDFIDTERKEELSNIERACLLASKLGFIISQHPLPAWNDGHVLFHITGNRQRGFITVNCSKSEEEQAIIILKAIEYYFLNKVNQDVLYDGNMPNVECNEMYDLVDLDLTNSLETSSLEPMLHLHL